MLITNAETRSQRQVATDEAGRFYSPSLPVGSYEVSVDKSGFRAEKRTGLVLTVGQREDLRFTLQVGDVRQTIEVSVDAGALSLTTDDTSGLVSEKQVKDLPLNGRSYDQLLTLNPGTVNYTSQRAGSTGTSNSVLGNMFAVSGRRPQDNLFLLNGIEYTGASEITVPPGGASGPPTSIARCSMTRMSMPSSSALPITCMRSRRPRRSGRGWGCIAKNRSRTRSSKRGRSAS